MFIDPSRKNSEEKIELHNEFLDKEKPDLCHKCGRCCKAATSGYTDDQIRKMAEEGDEDALGFLEVFVPFDSIEEAKKVVPEQVDQVVKEVLSKADGDVSKLTFYHCKYVTEEGLCGIYEKRPNVCRRAPQSGWALMPPGCGFEGWQFLMRENQRAEIRKLKEMQFQMQQLAKQNIELPRDIQTINKEVDDTIESWQRYGSKHW